MSRDQALPFWYSRFGGDWAHRLEKRLSERHFPSSMRFITKAYRHPYYHLVQSDVRKMAHSLRAIKDVAKSDAREAIFWILLPQTLASLFVKGCQRRAVDLRKRIRHAV